MKKRGKGKEPHEAKGKREIKRKGGALGKEVKMGRVSLIVKVRYWQPYNHIDPPPLKMSWLPPPASPLKKAGVATDQQCRSIVSAAENLLCSML